MLHFITTAFTLLISAYNVVVFGLRAASIIGNIKSTICPAYAAGDISLYLSNSEPLAALGFTPFSLPPWENIFFAGEDLPGNLAVRATLRRGHTTISTLELNSQDNV